MSRWKIAGDDAELDQGQVDAFIPMETLEPRLLLSGDLIGVEVAGYAAGGSALDNGKTVSGGAGGTIDVRTGVEVTSGTGQKGLLDINTTLTSGTYNFEQVGTGAPGDLPVITIDGDVTINCVTLFSAEIRMIFHPGGPAPEVHIFAGPAVDYYGGATDVHDALTFALDPGSLTKADGSGLAGATVQFWTSQGGDIVADGSGSHGWSGVISADGGAGAGGGAGGAGGSVTLIAAGAAVRVATVTANGAAGDSPYVLPHVGGAGGAGGSIVLAGQTLSLADGAVISADGGEGGAGFTAKVGQPTSFDGGAGGAGGSVVVDVQQVVGTPTVTASGGAGGLGGDGLSGQFAGAAGTNGADGGPGGAAGVIVGLTGISAVSGAGGAGGAGGQGANGYESQTGPGGAGGAGGAGGRGGDAGGPDAAAGQGGPGGSGGFGGWGTVMGADGPTGLDGPTGGLATGTPVTAPLTPAFASSEAYVLSVGVVDDGIHFGGDRMARTVANSFIATGSVGGAEVLILNTADAGNLAKLQAAIARAEAAMQANETFIFYYDGEAGVLPPDADQTTGDEYLYLSNTSAADNMTDDQLRDAFNTATWDSVYKLFVLDTAYAGGFWGATEAGDTGDLATLPRTALLASAPEQSTSYAVPQANGYSTGMLGLALSTALDNLRGSGAVDFQTLFARTTLSGSVLDGTFGYSLGVDTTGLTPQAVTFDPVTFSTPDFALDLMAGDFAVGQFGTVGGTKNIRLTATDADGTIVTFTLTGPGVGSVLIAPDGWDLTVTGSDELSAVTIVTKNSGAAGDDGQVILGAVTVGDPSAAGDQTALKSFIARTADLAGDMTVTGSLGTLTLADIANGVITIGPRRPGDTKTAATIKVGSVRDSSIVAGLPIASLTVADWADTGGARDTVQAPSAAAITATGRAANAKAGIDALAGNFQADLTLTGSAAKAALGTVRIAGDVVGRVWDIEGDVTSINVKHMVQDTRIRALGSMGIIVLGGASGSDFLAGVPATVGRHAASSADFLGNQATIRSFRVTGWAVPKGQQVPYFFVDSNLSAQTIGSVNLLNVDYSSGSEPFGIWVLNAGTGKEIKSIQTFDAALKRRWNWPLKAGQTIPAGNFQVKKL